MKFVDEVSIRVEAGNGGGGCLSFRREKFIPRGGPDGGDGGGGGSIHLCANAGLNTLADFRHTRVFRAANGTKGKGRNCSGKSGRDLLLAVPLGTRVSDAQTGELIGELTVEGSTLEVARGGKGGLGNARFKSSTNRAPRKTTPGYPGEKRKLVLELQVLADVGLLGLPNAGKSTFLRAVSDARPKVADYPFTTLYPQLGVVRVGAQKSFVVADIPGLIAGAAEGAGLGIQFLKHLSRTRIILHLIDIAPLVALPETVAEAKLIVRELQNYDINLERRERWLVLNKIDLVPKTECMLRLKAIVKALAWNGPVYQISAINGHGCRVLVRDLARRLDALRVRRDSTFEPHVSDVNA